MARPISVNETVIGVKGDKTIINKTPTTTPMLLLASSDFRKTVTIYNNGSVTVYLGANGNMTSANGFPLLAQQTFVDEESRDAWYGVTASGTADLRIIEVW